MRVTKTQGDLAVAAGNGVAVPPLRPPRPDLPGIVGRGRETVRTSGGWAAKSALAGTAAWWLAGLIPAGADFYAPLVAVLSVRPTVARTFTDTGQRLLAVAVGLALGYAATQLADVHWWSLAVVLLLAALVSTWRRLGDQQAQVPIAALLLLLLAQEPTRYAESLIAQGALGALCAAAVNLLVVPPLHVRDAQHAVSALRTRLGDLLDQMSKDVASDEWPTGDRAWRRELQAVEEQLDGAKSAVRTGWESVRFNPRARPLRSVPKVQRETLLALEHVSVAVREVALLLTSAAEDEGPLELNDVFRPRLADTLHILASAVSACGSVEPSPDAASTRRALDEADRAVRRLHDDVRSWEKPGLPAFLAEGALLVQLDRMLDELRRAPGDAPTDAPGRAA